MPSMSFMLEALVTTLLSLDYLHQQAEPPLPYKHQPHQHPMVEVPARCRSRSNSLSSAYSNESNESESQLVMSSSHNLSQSMPSTTSSMTAAATREASNAAEYSNAASSSSNTASSNASPNAKESPSKTTRQYQYHCPPTGSDMDYENNDTVFGAILRGELPAVTLAESDRLLALEDIKPRAPLHALIIPKSFVGSIFDVTTNTSTLPSHDPGDLDWMMEAQTMALALIQHHHPVAYARGDYRLAFHIPPFNSVNHLHLHVLAPLSDMTFFYKYIKYHPRTRWCISLEEVLERLQAGHTSVP